MQVTKKYKAGGFFGNSQDKFDHMAGAEGGFDRKEFRELRRKKRRGESLRGTEAQRLSYMKNVRGDRIKKGIAGAALAGTAAAVAGPAIAAKLAAKAGGKGLAGLAGKGATGAGKFGKLKSLFGKAKKVKNIYDGVQDMIPENQQATDEDINMPNENYARNGMRVMKGEAGMKIPEGADVRSLLAALDNLSEEKKRRRKKERTQIAPSLSDKEMNDKVLSALLERFKDSTPSMMGPKATDRYFNR